MADRDSLVSLLASIPDERPLTAVLHTAGVLDDGVIGGLSREQLDRVLRPKVDGALYLHELTRDLPLAAFVLFSSVIGTLGGAGQANYAAGNAFLDALASHRRPAGLAATSIAWGLWEEQGGMTGRLTAADRSRLARSGVVPLESADGLAPLTPPCGPARATRRGPLSFGALGAAGTIPPPLRALVPAPPRQASRTADTGSQLPAKMASLPQAEREQLVLRVVRDQSAAVLGHRGSGGVDPGRGFKDLGFDSLTAVELRNRLGAVTGLRLPATMVFDYPTPRALAELRAHGAGRRHSRGHGGRPARSAPRGRRADRDRRDGLPLSRAGSRSPEDLWDLVAAGGEGIGEFPADRGWDLDGLYDPDPDHAGTSTPAGRVPA